MSLSNSVLPLTHKEVLENPDALSRTVLSKGLDAGTALKTFNRYSRYRCRKKRGAQLQTDQAEADKRIAQAKAEAEEESWLLPETEMKAMVQEMRAKVVEAEAEVPKALATALREGKLGVMDYYNMQNILSDQMRNSISRQANRMSPQAIRNKA